MTAATMTAAGIGRRGPNNALSEAAGELANRLGGLLTDLREPLSLGGSYAEALRSLAEVAEETAHPDWDGYGASAIQPEAVHNARKLLGMLPTNFPAPEIAVDPDGEVALEWCRRGDWVFSISVGRDGILTFAGRFGRENRVRGIEYMGSDEIPSEIIGYLSRIITLP